jgi:amino acid permease
MTDFDPSNPDPHKRMNWALLHYGWVIIPLVVLLFMLEVAADSVGYDGKLIVQVGFLVFFAMAFFYDRRAKRNKIDGG